ncbi:MAG: hypothetical protein Q9165_004130 [Trypethelium subeluteriae]
MADSIVLSLRQKTGNAALTSHMQPTNFLGQPHAVIDSSVHWCLGLSNREENKQRRTRDFSTVKMARAHLSKSTQHTTEETDKATTEKLCWNIIARQMRLDVAISHTGTLLALVRAENLATDLTGSAVNLTVGYGEQLENFLNAREYLVINKEKDEDPDDKTDVQSEVYNDLESLEPSNGSGWNPLRVVTRAHGIDSIGRAMRDRRLDWITIDGLVDCTMMHGAFRESQGLVEAFLRQTYISSDNEESKSTASYLEKGMKFLDDYSRRGYSTAFQMRQLSVLFASGRYPIEWASQQRMLKLWAVVLMSLSRRDQAHDAAAHLTLSVLQCACDMNIFGGDTSEKIPANDTEALNNTISSLRRGEPHHQSREDHRWEEGICEWVWATPAVETKAYMEDQDIFRGYLDPDNMRSDVSGIVDEKSDRVEERKSEVIPSSPCYRSCPSVSSCVSPTAYDERLDIRETNDRSAGNRLDETDNVEDQAPRTSDQGGNYENAIDDYDFVNVDDVEDELCEGIFAAHWQILSDGAATERYQKRRAREKLRARRQMQVKRLCMLEKDSESDDELCLA